MEVMVEGMNPARGQISGRSSQNKPVNFTCASAHRSGTGKLLASENHSDSSKQSGGEAV